MVAWAGVAEKDRGALSDNPNGITLVESGAYTASGTGAEFSAEQSAIVEVVLVATASAATPVICFCVEGFNEASGTWENLIGPSVAVTPSACTKFLQINPFVPSVTGISAQRVTRRRMRVTTTHEDTDSITYSIRAYGIPR